MSLRKRLISCVLAAAIALSTIPTLTFSASAEEGGSGRVEWTGFDTSDRTFSVWDGSSYDVSWYTGDNGRTVHAGTVDDPYLIESVNDLAGLGKLSNNSENLSYGKLKDTYAPATTPDNAYIFYDKSRDKLDPGAYFLARSNSNNSRNYNFVYTIESTPVVDYADEPLTYYANITAIDIEINGVHTICSDVVEPFLAQLSSHDTFFVRPVTAEEMQNGTGSLYPEQYRILEFIQAKRGSLGAFMESILEWDMTNQRASFGDYCEYSFDTLGISFAGREVMSSAGEIRILGDDTFDKYDFLQRPSSSYNIFSNAYGYPLATHTDVMRFELSSRSYDTRNYKVSQSIKTPVEYYYFQDTRISTDDYRLNTDSVFYVTLPSSMRSTYTLNISTGTKKFTVYLKKGSITLASHTVDMSAWTEGTKMYASDNYDSLYMTLSDTGILSVYMDKVGVCASGYSVTGYHQMEDPLLFTYDTGIYWPVYSMDGTEVATFDPANYVPISFNKLYPTGTYSSMTKYMTDWGTEESTLSHYDTLTADDPSFSSKYFKLTCDIDSSLADLMFIPENALGQTRYGFAGDFDLDGHIFRTKGTFIGTIKEEGCFHDGTILIVDSKQGILQNEGTICNLLAMRDDLATMTPIGYDFGAQHLIGSNSGVVEHIDIKTGVRKSLGVVTSNNNLVQNIDFTIVHPYETGSNYANIASVVGGGSADSVLRNVVIDADKDVIGSDSDNIRIATIAGSGLVENLVIKDFDVYGEVCMPFGVYADKAVNCASYIDNIATSSQTSAGIIGGGTLLENCTIHSSSTVQPNSASTWKTIKDCDIYLSGCFQQSEMFGSSNFVNTKLTVEANKYGGNMIRGNIYNSEIRVIDNPSFTASWGGQPSLLWSEVIEDSYIYVDDPLVFSNELISYEKCKSVKNTVFDLPSITKYHSVIGAMHTTFEDCIFNFNYKGCTDYKSTLGPAHSGTTYKDCKWFITFDEDCAYSDYSYYASLPYGNLDNCFMYAKSESDEFAFKNAVFAATSMAPNISGLTVILDNIGIKGSKPCIFGSRDNMYAYGYPVFENVTVLTKNLRVNSDDGLLRLMLGKNNGPTTHDLYMDIQLAEPSRNVGIIGVDSGWNNAHLSDVVVKSNTTNPQSALVSYLSGPITSIMMNYYSPIVQNVYWDLRDAQNNIVPSETADGYVPGLAVGYDCYGSFASNYFTAGTILSEKLIQSNIIVPTGNSVVSQYYNADTTTLDSWNATGRRNELWNSAYTPNTDDYGQVVDFIADTSNITYVDDPETAMLDGSLAYMLDNGSSQYRRSRNWTVLEEDVQIKNPVTNEIVGVIPKGLALSHIVLPEDILVQEVNTDPVYKVIIEDAEMGSVTAQGLADTSSAGERSIYVKSNTVLHPDERVDSDDVILAYALQSFYDSTPSRIPNQASAAVDTVARQQENGVEAVTVTRMLGAAGESEYTLDGYSIGSADVRIIPVFAYARHVSVSVENAEHGTITPSATVTAAGEVIRLILTSDPGYIVTDIKANGVPVSGDKFVMPDEDVLITGTVVPFDGGITKFSLFGFEGDIDQYAHTITLTVPRMGNIANAVADIEYVGDFITPSVDAHVDFTSPVTYTVTYGEGLTVDYVVTVNQAEYTMRIYDFVLDGVHGTINQATRTITVALPVDTDLSNMIPTDISYSAESISPTTMTAVDFRVPQVYTLSTAGLSNVSYIVNVVAADESDAVIDQYIYAGYDGEIDNIENTITLNLPKGMNTDAAVPSMLDYTGKSITPTKTTPLTITDDPLTTGTYTVTAQNGATRTYTLLANYLSSDTAKITEFVLGGEEGVINEEEKTITVTLSESVNIVDVAPDTLTYEGKSLYPNKTLEQDFTDPVVYTVVAPDNSEVPYTVEVVRLSNEALITEFEINGYAGVIDQAAKTITVTLPYGTDVSDIAPNKIVYSENAVLSPSATTKRDFTTPQVYNVTSQDNLVSNNYTVTCIVAPDYDNKITRYVLDGVEGVITDIGANLGNISVTIKERVTMPDYNDIAPSIVTVSQGAILAPAATTKMDFVDNNPVYTVTGGLSGTRTYTVTLTIIPLDRTAEITKYAVGEYAGIIDQDTGDITVTVPADAGIDVTNIIPTIEWHGETLIPTDNAAVNLSSPVDYLVTAEDPRVTKAYKVTLVLDGELSDDCIITKYAVNGNYAVINQQTGDMTLTILKSQKAHYEGIIVPSTIEWRGQTLTPNAQTGVNIFDEPIYTVTAENGDVKTYTVKVNIQNDDPPAPDTCIITAYSFNGVAGRINQQTGVITIDVPKAKKSEFSVIKAPDYITWEGAALSPVESAAVDIFASPEYIVTAESGATKTYVVKANIIDTPTPPTPPIPVPPGPSDDCVITKYGVVGVKGEINQTALTITLNVPLSKKDALTNVVPDKIEWCGETLAPSERTAVTVADGLTYTVTAESGKQKTYTIKLNWVDDRNTDCIITHYAVAGVNGVIDQNALTITLDVPLSQKGELNNVVPDRVLWKGKTLTPTEKTAVTIVDGLTYTVTAENPNISKTYTIKLNWVDDRDADCIITYYKALGIAGEIDQKALTITMPIPLSKKGAVENVVPDKIKWRGATLSPTEQDEVTLFDGLTYTVTAENGNSKTYTIKIDWIDDRDDDCIITYYKAVDIVGTIDQAALTITMAMPLSNRDVLDGIVPDKIKWRGETLTPTEDDAINLEDGLTYTVTAENGNSKTYTIKIEWVDDRSTDCIITAYKVCGVEAEIDQDALTINLEIPEARKQHCTNIAPDEVVWRGDKLSPTDEDGIDLTGDLIYRVYAENRAVYKDYTVNVKWLNEPVEDNPGPDDEPEDNPNTGIADDRMLYARLLLAMLIAAGAVVGTRKRKQ